MSKDLIRKQFGSHADSYRTSAVHAKGASLQRLVELVEPQLDWHALDVATGGGHTAAIFAPHVATVIASDLTPEMLVVAQRLADERDVGNMQFELADAENLPFKDDRFNLVTCRIAPHHFEHVDRFVAECHRVLQPGGLLAVVDNVVPSNEAGAYVNRFEKLRDPSHHKALTVEEWEDCFAAAGFEVTEVELARKRMEFQPWVERLGASPDVIRHVRDMLLNAPDRAAEFFQLETIAPIDKPESDKSSEQDTSDNASLYFYLTEAIVVGRKE